MTVTFQDFADGVDFILVPNEGSVPDERGRQTHTAFWIGMVGPRHEEVGIRGQVSFSAIPTHVEHLETQALDGNRRRVRVKDHG